MLLMYPYGYINVFVSTVHFRASTTDPAPDSGTLSVCNEDAKVSLHAGMRGIAHFSIFLVPPGKMLQALMKEARERRSTSNSCSDAYQTVKSSIQTRYLLERFCSVDS